MESSGLRGQIYFLRHDTEALPNFKHLKSVGTIYTTRLNIPPRDFKEGFPGISGRFEWFAIDYTGRFYVPAQSHYKFGLTSDDGSKLYIDGRAIIDNDGIHSPLGCEAEVELEPGTHTIRVAYMQGPGWQISLRLFIAKLGEPWRVFDTKDFLPPENSLGWTDDEGGKASVRKLSGGDCWAGR